MTEPVVGIIANPVSARDIRRVIANAASLQITDRANIVLRVLACLKACGVRRVVMMPDAGGIRGHVKRGLDRSRNRGEAEFPDVAFLEMPVTGTAEDSRRAAAAMRTMGAAAIVVLLTAPGARAEISLQVLDQPHAFVLSLAPLETSVAGIALIACCVLIPQADSNRRLAYEKESLMRDLHNIEQQIDVNHEFLRKVGEDPTLAQRLAERQMKVIPQGAHVVELTHDAEVMSPFQLLNVAPPAKLPPYRPVGGTLARICYGSQSRLYLIGMSLGLIAMGLVLGSAPSANKS